MTNDLKGIQYGWLLVVKKTERRTSNGTTIWKCKCNCGKFTYVAGPDLKRGSKNKSCGCYRKEFMKVKQTKHGMFGSTEYNIYSNMISRCYNKAAKDYPRYGGRGIKVCKRWKSSFENFFEDMGKRPLNKTLDRKDNNGSYSPKNCRWASSRTQSNNKSNNFIVNYSGKDLSLAQAIRKSGSLVTYQTVYNRIKIYGWSVRQAIETPTR